MVINPDIFDATTKTKKKKKLSYKTIIFEVLVAIFAAAWKESTWKWHQHKEKQNQKIKNHFLGVLFVHLAFPSSFPLPEVIYSFFDQASFYPGSISCNWKQALLFLLVATISPRFYSVQFSSVTQSCLTRCDPMNHSTPGLRVHYQLPESTQTQVHWAGDATQPSHPLSSPSPLALNLSQHQGLFKWVSSLQQVAKVLELQGSISCNH